MRSVTAEHYFTAEPSGPSRPTQVEFDAAGRHFRMAAGSGVFSAGRLDPGTAVLLRKAPPPPPGTQAALLDLGCGYGPIALALAAAASKAAVYAVDVNQRALELVRENAAAHDLTVVAATPDNVPSDLRFVQIWSNPPIRIGKQELHALLEAWFPRLLPGGTAWLVVARNLGADSLHAWLNQRGWATVRHASQKGYRVLRVEKPADGPGGSTDNA
jgi:16S rRNA (guanine1207-N2)-methyltransferase